MSEAGFLATAQILVRPDITGFREDLERDIKKALASAPITIPVVPIVAGGGIAAVSAETGAFTAAQKTAAIQASITAAAIGEVSSAEQINAAAADSAAAATQALAASQEKAALAAKNLAVSEAAAARSQAGFARGAGASALTLLGLRGATLAASGAFLAGTAAIVAFSKSVQSAANLETELNVFKVTAGATADEMDRVSASAKQLGRDITLPGVTAGSAAVAMTELAKAGLSVSDAMAAARGTLQLATAAQIDNANAAKLVSSALNSFELDGSQAVKVADLFAGAAANAQGSIEDFGPALAQASAVAHGFGISIEDTVTLLTQLAKGGIEGGRAGTSLRVALLRLVKPPADAAKALKDLNIQIRDANGNLRPQVFTDIEKALQGVSKAQRQATEATIFGSDAVRTQILLGQQGADAFNEISKAVNESGLAQQQAAARTQGFQGDVENLQNQVSALGLTIGQVSIGPLSVLVKALANTVDQMALTVDGAVQLGNELKGMASSVDAAVPGLGFLDDHLGDIAKKAQLINPLALTLKVASDAAKHFGVDAQDAGKKTAVFGGIADTTTKSINDLANALTAAATATRAQAPADTGLGVKQIENVIGGFDAEAVRARIDKNNQELVDVLNTEQKFLEAQLQRDFVKNRPALKRLIEQSLLGVVTDIDSVQSKATSAAAALKAKADKAAADAAAAVRARQQALLSSQGLARDQRQNKIDAAAQTAGLNDDIKQQQLLKALVLKQIAEVRSRISVEGGRVAAVTALRAVLNQVNSSLQGLAQQQRDAQQAQRDALLQAINLDINFAQITDNQAAEVAARNRAIAVLNRQLAAEAKAHGKTTVAYKTIRNEIAEQNAALKAIVQEKQKGQSFAQASFDFLQAQQGFASNLLGNLIPSGATGGLVGGGSVQQALPPVASAAEASGKSGPTSGQSNATNHLLALILQGIKQLNGEQAAPEARRHNIAQRNTFDYTGAM